MLPSGFSRSSDRPGYGWIFALVGVVFLAFGIGRVEAAGPYSAAHGLKSPSVPSAAPSGPRVNHRAINRSNIGSRAGGSSRFSIDKSRLGNRKTIKTKRKAVKKPTGKKKITAKHSPAISNKVKDQAKKKATADVGQETPQLTELAKEHLPVPRPPQVGGRGTDAFDPDAANARKGQSALIGALTDASSGNATNNSTPYNEFAEAPALATESVITHVPGLTLAAWDKLNQVKEAGAFQTTSPGEGGPGGQAGLGFELEQNTPESLLERPDGVEDERGAAHRQGPTEADIIGHLRGFENGPMGYGPGPYGGGTAGGYVNNAGSGAALALSVMGQGARSGGPELGMGGIAVMGSGAQKNGVAPWKTDGGHTNPDMHFNLDGSGYVVIRDPSGSTRTVFIDADGNPTATIDEHPDGSAAGFDLEDSEVQIDDPDTPVVEGDITTEPAPEPDDEGTQTAGGTVSPVCNPNNPGCDENTTREAEDAERRHRALVAVVTRSRTGQPAPHEGGDANGWVTNPTMVGHFQYLYGGGQDPDCRVMECNAQHEFSFSSNRNHTVWEILSWHPQVAPQ